MFYSDRVYNPKFNRDPVVKPLISSFGSPQNRTFMKFGMNLGPSRPVLSNDKYVKHSSFVQSPVMRAEKTKLLTDNFLVNQN